MGPELIGEFQNSVWHNCAYLFIISFQIYICSDFESVEDIHINDKNRQKIWNVGHINIIICVHTHMALSSIFDYTTRTVWYWHKVKNETIMANNSTV